MKTKLFLALGVMGLVLSLAPAAGAHHVPEEEESGSEGTITVAGVEGCSDENDTPGDSKCTWVAHDPGGWVGFGPFTITWEFQTIDPATGETITVTESASCPNLGQFCTSDDGDDTTPDPIPVGATVTSDGTGGGTFAAGDEDTSDGE